MIGFQRRFDPTFAALKARIDAGEIGEPEMLVVTSRDPGAPPVEYLKRSGGIFRDMLIHDFDIFRWILDDEAATVYATGSVLTDPAVGERRRRRLHRGHDPHEERAPRADQHEPPRRVRLRPALRGARAARACCRPATTGRPKSSRRTAPASARDKPEHFFLERYRAAYALEMAHFFDALAKGKPVRTSIDDGVKALELAEAATTSWREKRIVEL